MDAQTVVGGAVAVVVLAGFGWFLWTKIKASKEDDNSGSGGGGGGGDPTPVVENTPKGKKKVAVRKKAVANKRKGK